MSLAKKMPPSELPRERLIRDGIEALSLQELIAILLGTGAKGKSVLILAQELLLRFNGIQGLLNASIEDLLEVKGIGQAKAVILKASFGIALRSAKEGLPPMQKLKSLDEVAKIAALEIGHMSKEAILVLLLDTKVRLIHKEVVAIGTLSEVLFHPREVFQPAIRHGAHSLIICHNHPSGDPTPSTADIRLTKKLLECSKIVGIGLVDHVIIGKDCHFSLGKDYLHQ